jgi:hypothetical protein
MNLDSMLPDGIVHCFDIIGYHYPKMTISHNGKKRNQFVGRVLLIHISCFMCNAILTMVLLFACSTKVGIANILF